MKIKHQVPAQQARAKAYPPVGEQLDAIYKMAVALRDAGISLPPETMKWIGQCQAVKTRYPS